MKQVTLEKAIRKAGFTVLPPDPSCYRYNYSVDCGGAWMTFHVQGEDAICVRVARKGDRDDMLSDYFAGSFYDTIKGAMLAVTYYNSGRWDR